MKIIGSVFHATSEVGGEKRKKTLIHSPQTKKF